MIEAVVKDYLKPKTSFDDIIESVLIVFESFIVQNRKNGGKMTIENLDNLFKKINGNLNVEMFNPDYERAGISLNGQKFLIMIKEGKNDRELLCLED